MRIVKGDDAPLAAYFTGLDGQITPEREAEIRADEARLEAERLAKEAAEQRAYLVEHGFPVKDLERVMGDEVQDTRPVQAAREALEAGSVLLVLSGTRGCGKTTAAGWWLVQSRPLPGYVKTRPALFVDASQLSRWSRYDDAAMRDLERAKALVIDDLGIEYDDKHGAFRSFVDGLVNARYAACLPTCITTNLPAADFRARYGERVADRIRESGRFVEVNGESMRRRA